MVGCPRPPQITATKGAVMIVIGLPHRPLTLLQLKDEAAAAADQAASSSPPVRTLRWVNRAVAQQSATHQQGAVAA